jgi:hypothetical protein
MLKLCFWPINDLILDFQLCAWNVKIEGDTAVCQLFIFRVTVESHTCRVSVSQVVTLRHRLVGHLDAINCVKVRHFVAFAASRDHTLRSFDLK